MKLSLQMRNFSFLSSSFFFFFFLDREKKQIRKTGQKKKYISICLVFFYSRMIKTVSKGNSCPKHPEHSTEEVFCLETKTFHCALCAREGNVKDCPIADAIDKFVGDADKQNPQLKANLQKISERNNKLQFELNDDKNPDNITNLVEKAKVDITSTFNKLRSILEKREKDLLDKLDEISSRRCGLINNESTELDNILFDGNDVLQEYEKLKSGERDTNFLKMLIKLEKVTNNSESVLKKYEAVPIIPARLGFVLEEKDKLFEKFNNIGVVSETVVVPVPTSFSVASKDYKSINLTWNTAVTELPVSYKVLMKKVNEPSDEWTECYNGTETKCTCDNLKRLTKYEFKLFTVYDSMKSTEFINCSDETEFDWPPPPWAKHHPHGPPPHHHGPPPHHHGPPPPWHHVQRQFYLLIFLFFLHNSFQGTTATMACKYFFLLDLYLKNIFLFNFSALCTIKNFFFPLQYRFIQLL